jgi:transposase-like protein
MKKFEHISCMQCGEATETCMIHPFRTHTNHRCPTCGFEWYEEDKTGMWYRSNAWTNVPTGALLVVNGEKI